ncbi:MAG: hypothetical protein Q4C37_02235 [Bacteroidales bacterium]|nr:hypothetical protein [Bacteroidales bacterium]
MIEDLPLRYEEKLLSYEDDIIKERLSSRDIETLKYKLTHGSIATDIDNGILGEPEDDDVTISNRLKYTRRKTKDILFKIEDPKDVYGLPDYYSSRWYLAKVMDDAEAYDYINTVFIICREWNLVVDCLLNTLSEREEEVNPQPQPSKAPTPVKNSDFWSNEELKPILDEAVNRGFMEKFDNGFKWLRSNPLLAYFIKVLSLYMDLSEKLYDDEVESVNWSYFSGVFLTKRQGGNWDYADGTKLHDYMHSNKRGKTEFLPKGFEDIEDLMSEFR